MSSPNSLDGGYLDERFTSASFGSDRLPVPSVCHSPFFYRSGSHTDHAMQMQHLFGNRRSSSVTTSDIPVDTPDDTASDQGSTHNYMYNPTPPDLNEQVQRLQTQLYDLEDRHDNYVRYNQNGSHVASDAMYNIHQQLAGLERKLGNLDLDCRLDALSGVNLDRIEAQEQHTSFVLDSLQRQINALQHDLASTKAHERRDARDHKPSTASDDLAFLRACLLNDDLSHADRYAALEIVARMRRQIPPKEQNDETPVSRSARVDSVFGVRSSRR